MKRRITVVLSLLIVLIAGFTRVANARRDWDSSGQEL